MAIYFLNLKTFGRSGASSAVSAAAYRAGERIRDERTGRTYDHADRRDVLHKQIMLPNRFAADDMSWAKDRGNLWNSAEHAESRGNARTAREYLIALPVELSPQARINLVIGFSRELVERYRFALDIAIHAPRDFPGSDPRNFHAHLLATTREATSSGLGAKTALEWSDTRRRQNGLGPAIGELLHVRERWAAAANTALEQAQVNARIDHRTLRAQGIDREPWPHIPRAAFEMERHGYYSVVAERIRAEHQARVEARVLLTAQAQPVAAPKDPQDVAKESALRWLRYRQAQEAQEAQEQERGQGQAGSGRTGSQLGSTRARRRSFTMIEGIAFASCYVYSPAGDSAICARSRLLRALLKAGEAPFMIKYAARVRQQVEPASQLAGFFLSGDVLVPVPRCAPTVGGTWVAAELARALVREGVGASTWPGLRRVFAVRKSSTAAKCCRPTVTQHYESLRLEALDFRPASVVLIDDVITKGRTFLAAATRVREALPDTQIRAFALLRTMGLISGVRALLEPCRGEIRWRDGDARRNP